MLTHIENCRAAITNCTREGAVITNSDSIRRYQRCPVISHGKLCSLITLHSDLVQQGHALVTYDHWDSRRDGNTLWNRKAVRLILIRHQCLLKACQRVGHFPCRDREVDHNWTAIMLNSQCSGRIKRCIVHPIIRNCLSRSRINIYSVSFCISIDVVAITRGWSHTTRVKSPGSFKATTLDIRHTFRQAIGHNALIQTISDGLSNGRKCLIKAVSIVGIIGVLFVTILGRLSSNTIFQEIANRGAVSCMRFIWNQCMHTIFCPAFIVRRAKADSVDCIYVCFQNVSRSSSCNISIWATIIFMLRDIACPPPCFLYIVCRYSVSQCDNILFAWFNLLNAVTLHLCLC